MSLESKIKDGWHHYHADVEWSCLREIKGAADQMGLARRKSTTVTVHAPSADSAMSQVHAAMQKAKELNLDRQILRPMLTPDEYRVTKLFIPYKDAKSNELEHVFDLPVCANPDLRPDKTPPVVTDAMPFFDEAKGQGALSS